MNKDEKETTMAWTTPTLSKSASALRSTATCRPSSDPRPSLPRFPVNGAALLSRLTASVGFC